MGLSEMQGNAMKCNEMPALQGIYHFLGRAAVLSLEGPVQGLISLRCIASHYIPSMLVTNGHEVSACLSAKPR
jgi:hypothetical protein